MRSSVYIEGRGGEKLLIDAGPEFRLQALRAGIKSLDGIFLTHSHADHIHGLDDVRPLSRQAPIPVYGNKKTIAEMIERFSYAFDKVWKSAQQGGSLPRLAPQVVDDPVRIGGLEITPVPVKHGDWDILGWEVCENAAPPGKGRNSFLYLTDTSAIPPSSRLQLSAFCDISGKGSEQNTAGRRVIIIGALRIRPHVTHFGFEDALDAALDLGASEVYLTHFNHEHSHEEIETFCRLYTERKQTPSNIADIAIHPAFDGMEIVL
jgi:phosphoribosyl 1,2-cyclic phosphate phosphodiesterase